MEISNQAADEAPLDDTSADGGELLNVSEDPTSPLSRTKAAEVSLLTGVAPDVVSDSLSRGDLTEFNEAKSEVLRDAALVEQEIAENAIVQRMGVDELETDIVNFRQKTENLGNASDALLEQALATNNPDYLAVHVNLTSNISIAAGLLEAEMEGAGLWDKFIGFGDRYILRQMGAGAYEDIQGRSTTMGEVIREAAISMPNDEFTVFFKEYVEKLRGEGAFIEGNWWAFMQGMDEATNGGYDAYDSTNRTLAILDIFGAGAGVKALSKAARARVKKVLASDSTLTRAAAMTSPEAAADMGAGSLKAAKAAGEEANPETLANVTSGLVDVTTSPTRPSEVAYNRIMAEDKLVNDLLDNADKGRFGRLASGEEIQEAAEAAGKAMLGRTDFPLASARFLPNKLDRLGNYSAVVQVGRLSDGAPFKGKTPKHAEAAATRAAKDVEGASVVPVDAEDLTKGYYVQLEGNLDLSGLAPEMNVSAQQYGLVRDIYGRYLGSSRSRDDSKLTTLVQRAEGGFTGILGDLAPVRKTIEKLSPSEEAVIRKVHEELLNGEDAFVRGAYSDLEFKEKYKQFHPNGDTPSKKAVDGWKAVQSISDAAWLARADQSLKQHIALDYYLVDTGLEGAHIARRLDKIPETGAILNTQDGGVVGERFRGDLKTVWELAEPIPSKPGRAEIKYVAEPQNVKMLSHSDVMGYNAGGTRDLTEANHFVTITSGNRARAIMTAFSETEAKKAAQEIDTIRQAVNALDRTLDELEGTDLLDEVVLKNNSWNPKNVYDTETFIKHARKQKWDMGDEAKLGTKGRNKAVDPVEELGGNKFHPMSGRSMEELVRNDWTRSDTVLPAYGGKQTHTADPISSVVKQFEQSWHTAAFHNYTRRALTSWVKRAKAAGDNVKWGGLTTAEAAASKDVDRLFSVAEVTGSGSEYRRLRERKEIIERRLSTKDKVVSGYEDFATQLSEWIHDKSRGKLSVNLQDVPLANTMLGAGHQAAFGFYSIAQFFMQSFHIATMAVADPIHGGRAAANVLALRFAMMMPTKAGETEVLRRLAAFESKFTGKTIPVEFYQELVDYMHISGRTVVDGEVASRGTGASFNVSNWGNQSFTPGPAKVAVGKAKRAIGKVARHGTIFFREGERMSRIAAITAGFYKLKAELPNTSALSDLGQDFIARREQDLSFNMTTMARPAALSGKLKVPTQWLSYPLRAHEAVIYGNGLTGAERARLFAVLFPMYGLAGFGAERYAAEIGESFGINPDSPWLSALKLGVIDGLTDWGSKSTDGVIPASAVAPRLAPVTAFFDTYEKLTDGKFGEVILGPSGEIIGGVTNAFIDITASILRGTPVAITEGAIRILRQPSGIDANFKGLGIIRNGTYRTKNGTKAFPTDQVGELSTSEGVMQLLGFQGRRVYEWQQSQSLKYDTTESFRKFRKEIKKEWDVAHELMRSDPERGIRMLHELRIKIKGSYFHPTKEAELLETLYTVPEEQYFGTLRFLVENGLDAERRLLESAMKGIN